VVKTGRRYHQFLQKEIARLQGKKENTRKVNQKGLSPEKVSRAGKRGKKKMPRLPKDEPEKNGDRPSCINTPAGKLEKKTKKWKGKGQKSTFVIKGGKKTPLKPAEQIKKKGDPAKPRQQHKGKKEKPKEENTSRKKGGGVLLA